ncbi:MAG TPA: replication-relaxation family protein [Gemmatimonadales bacterium]|nr:replication-relaxation family protein [Gemmatimonadales bacterium]
MEAVIQTKKAGRNRQLTERDRELCGFLAVCRYLTREQIERLMFRGRSKARSSTRLKQLATKIGGQGALLRGDLGYASAEGWTTVWAVTAEGFEVGSQLLNLQPRRIPKHDVGPAFLHHEVMLNEIFLGLVAHDGKTPARVPRNFRWLLGEYLDLPFEEYVRDPRQGLGLEKRRLQPDAMLEDPAGRRRYFIEYETGSATIRDAKKSTSTMSKLDRYGTFLQAPSDNLVAGQRETYYAHIFNDGWPAEVLFVTRTEARRDSITRVSVERERSGKFKFPVPALTLAETHGVLCRALYGADRPPGNAPHGPSTVAAPRAPTATSTELPARSGAEERLRGRVSVRGEQLIKFEKLLRSSLAALNSAEEMVTRLRVPDGSIPSLLRAAPETMRVLAEYARRGEHALARYGLTKAD